VEIVLILTLINSAFILAIILKGNKTIDAIQNHLIKLQLYFNAQVEWVEGVARKTSFVISEIAPEKKPVYPSKPKTKIMRIFLDKEQTNEND